MLISNPKPKSPRNSPIGRIEAKRFRGKISLLSSVLFYFCFWVVFVFLLRCVSVSVWFRVVGVCGVCVLRVCFVLLDVVAFKKWFCWCVRECVCLVCKFGFWFWIGLSCVRWNETVLMLCCCCCRYERVFMVTDCCWFGLSLVWNLERWWWIFLMKDWLWKYLPLVPLTLNLPYRQILGFGCWVWLWLSSDDLQILWD
jgi:hypothetical protein